MSQIVDLARQWIGTPYHHQGSLKGAGTDCLGLVRGIWRELYGTEPEVPPPYTQTWGEYRTQETMLEAAERNFEKLAMANKGTVLQDPKAIKGWAPGLVLCFRLRPSAVAKHCAILSGEDTIIHAYSGVGVCETSLGIWETRVAGVFKFPGS